MPLPLDDGGSELSPDQISTLIAIERTGASLSMAAITVTVASFLAVPRLRSTPNMFLVFASIANAGASIASMVGYDGLLQGENSALCQAQGFIFEWFMQADPWWSFAMAFNVFVVFYCNVDPTCFRKYVWLYIIVCFGGPLIPAITLISIRDDERGPVYGDAALWCWIGPKWSLVRLYAYYIPIWVCIFLSILIYIAVGYQVFHHRNRLRSVAFQSIDKDGRVTSGPSSDSGESAVESLARRLGYYATAVTEVHITTAPPPCDEHGNPISPEAAQTTTVISCRKPCGSDREDAGEIPDQGQLCCGACCHDSPHLHRLRALKSSASMKLRKLDPVKMAYLRTSFIFGFAVLITWIPSSVNRLYSIANNGRINFPLSAISGSVLPLQGLWNALIYFTTSWKVVGEEVRSAKMRIRNRRASHDLEMSLNNPLSQEHFNASPQVAHCGTQSSSRRKSFRMDDLEIDGGSEMERSPSLTQSLER